MKIETEQVTYVIGTVDGPLKFVNRLDELVWSHDEARTFKHEQDATKEAQWQSRNQGCHIAVYAVETQTTHTISRVSRT